MNNLTDKEIYTKLKEWHGNYYIKHNTLKELYYSKKIYMPLHEYLNVTREQFIDWIHSKFIENDIHEGDKVICILTTGMLLKENGIYTVKTIKYNSDRLIGLKLQDKAGVYYSYRFAKCIETNNNIQKNTRVRKILL